MTDDVIKKTARAICSACGENPDHVDASGQPRWIYYEQPARAAIDAYLSKMPRAWALKVGSNYRAQSNLGKRDVEFDNAIMRGLGQVVEVAIIELPGFK